LLERHRAREQRLDARTAQITWILAEIHRNKAERPAPYKLEDFLLSRPPAHEPTDDERKARSEAMLQQVQMLNVLFKGKDLRPCASPPAVAETTP